MTNTFERTMVRRKSLSDSIKFEEPGSDEYLKLDKMIREIDSGIFTNSTPNIIPPRSAQ